VCLGGVTKWWIGINPVHGHVDLIDL